MKLIKIIKIITVFLFFIFIFVKLWSNYKIYPLHIDEHEYIRKSVYFDLFSRGDFSNSRWQEFDAYDEPKLAIYLYGLSLRLAGIKNIKSYLDKIKFNGSWQWGDYFGNLWTKDKWWIQLNHKSLLSLPTDINFKLTPIFQARKVAITFSFGVLLLIFLIGCKLKGWLFGLIATFLLFKNPLFQLYSKRAMGDMPLLFFLLMTLFFSFLFLKIFYQAKTKKAFSLASLIGITIGLATASKLNGGMGFIYFLFLLFFIFLVSFLQNKENLFYKKIFISGSIVTFLFLFVFIFLNPFIWKKPFWNFQFMFLHRIKTGIWQQRRFSENKLDSFTDKASFVFRETLFPSGNWHTFETKDFPLDLILFLVGFILLNKASWKSFSQTRRINKNFLVLLWTIVIFICVIIYIPMNWDRYYLPLIPGIVFCQSLTIFSGLKLLFGKNKQLMIFFN